LGNKRPELVERLEQVVLPLYLKDESKLILNIMKKLQFKVSINAPATQVYDCMLGINSKSTYEQWTSLFNPTSTYEGSWDKGNKMLFIGIDEKGEKGGMVSRIAENISNRFVSIQHYGVLKADKEITEGPEVEKWANGFENYTFQENNVRQDDPARRGTTTVTVDLDTAEDFLDYINQTYPKALDKLKEICEK
jgi:hypothetical protein